MYNNRYKDIGGMLFQLFYGNIDVCRLLLKEIKEKEEKENLKKMVIDQIKYLFSEYIYKSSVPICYPSHETPLYKYILLKNRIKNSEELF